MREREREREKEKKTVTLIDDGKEGGGEESSDSRDCDRQHEKQGEEGDNGGDDNHRCRRIQIR